LALDRALRLSVDLRVRHPQFYADAAFGGTLGAGEAYIKGYWDTNDLTALVRIMPSSNTAWLKDGRRPVTPRRAGA